MQLFMIQNQVYDLNRNFIYFLGTQYNSLKVKRCRYTSCVTSGPHKTAENQLIWVHHNFTPTVPSA